jgi:RNA polymerase sigma-70 factor (ECF subfamily)
MWWSDEWWGLNERNHSQTDLSLLERMGDSRYRADAWAVFVNRYTQLFFFWFRHWGVNIDDMEDVLQDSIVRVFKDLKYFDRRRQGSFRAWLKALAENSWRQLIEDADRQLAARKSISIRVENWRLLSTKIAEDQLLKLFDTWATQELIELAQANVRRRIHQETWQTYAAVTFENRPIEELEATLGIPANTIYSRVFRVRKMLREEMDLLDV